MKLRCLGLALVLAGCGGDDSEESAKPPPKCSSDAKLSGGVTTDASVEYDCADGGGYTKTADHVTVEVRLPGDTAGVVSVRIFGLKADTASGSTLPTGIALDVGLPPTDHFEAGMANGSACTTTIVRQDAQPTEGEVLLTANVSCTEPLVSGASTSVSVERLNLKALYGP